MSINTIYKKMSLRLSVIVLLALLAGMGNTAQADNGRRSAGSMVTPPDSSVTTKTVTWPRLMLGFRAGAGIPSLLYSDASMANYKHNPSFREVAALFFQVPLGSPWWSLRPEVAYVVRGDSLSYEDVRYTLRSRYVDVRLPLTFRLPFRGCFAPYLMAVPHFDIAVGGQLSYEDYDYPAGLYIPVSKANLKEYDAGVLVGGGLEWRIDRRRKPLFLSIEGGYNFGLVNTFSDRELRNDASTANPATIINGFLGSALWKGTRMNRGWEMSVRVTVPVDGKYAQYYQHRNDPEEPRYELTPESNPNAGDNSNGVNNQNTFYNSNVGNNTNTGGEVRVSGEVRVTGDVHIVDDRNNETQPRTIRTTDTVYIVRTDTVKVTEYKDRDVNPGIADGKESYSQKECYSILEIHGMIDRGMSISNKRICMFNINFAFNSHAVPVDAEDLLLDLLSLMRDYPEMVIEVYGHTDGVGSAEYNQKLSERRAQSVANYLINHGVAPQRVRSFGLGKNYPIAPETNEDGRFRNRRVEIEVIHVGRRFDE